MITRAHVQPYVGQAVAVRTREGTTHYGILHSVTNDGIYLRSMRGRAGLARASVSDPTPELLGELQMNDGDIEQAWWPFFFFPWFAMAAFWPWWGWW